MGFSRSAALDALRQTNYDVTAAAERLPHDDALVQAWHEELRAEREEQHLRITLSRSLGCEVQRGRKRADR